MPGKIETYRRQIRETSDIDSFLKRHSGLPGPRGNLELAHAFVHEAEASLIRRYAGFEPEEASENTPEAFLAFCGVFGLGRLILEGDLRAEGRLKARAADPRWRVRE
ncbi:MAG TPA: hypothetical protein VFI11_03310, partial [Anaerolineales bacterium]|nr:hypothetical protein [Anaerolineales bacterium]